MLIFIESNIFEYKMKSDAWGKTSIYNGLKNLIDMNFYLSQKYHSLSSLHADIHMDETNTYI